MAVSLHRLILKLEKKKGTVMAHELEIKNGRASMFYIVSKRWAKLCKYLGNLSPKKFKAAEKRLFPRPDSLKSRFERLFCFDQADCEGLPLVHFGPEKPFFT